MRPFAKFMFAGAMIAAMTGCAQPQVIVIDRSSDPVRFLVHDQRWSRFFATARVKQLAVASDTAVLWQLQSEDPKGLPATHLAFVYGTVPRGFSQVIPESGKAPENLKRLTQYYVAAGDPGEDGSVFNIVFALPAATSQPADKDAEAAGQGAEAAQP